MINFPDHFLFFYFCLYFKICKYDKDKEYFLFPFLLEKWKIRLAEVCTDPKCITSKSQLSYFIVGQEKECTYLYFHILY